MRRTIAVKRAELLREWMFAKFANDEHYYYSTLMMGIPDGDSLSTVLEDLQDGFYDHDIDKTINVYLRAKKAYSEHGYYYNGNVYHNGLDCLDAAGYELPEKITKTGKYSMPELKWYTDRD